MSKTIRVYLVVAVVAVVGLFVGFQVIKQTTGMIVGIGIAVLAVIVGLVLLRKDAGDDAEFFSAPETETKAEPSASASAAPAASTATAEPLATWQPEETLTPWTPPVESETTDITIVEEDEEPLDVLDLEELEHIDEFVEAEAASDQAVVVEELEVVEEAGPDLEDPLAAPVIEEIEDVHSDDDIMKASQATELSVAESGDNSELAKLLAKVQSRLAAYE